MSKTIVWACSHGSESLIEIFFKSEKNLKNSLILLPVIKTVFLDIDVPVLEKIKKKTSVQSTLVTLTSKTTIDSLERIPHSYFLKHLDSIAVGGETKKYARKHGYNCLEANLKGISELSQYVNTQNQYTKIIYPGAKIRAKDPKEVFDGSKTVFAVDTYMTKNMSIKEVAKTLIDPIKILEPEDFITCFSSPSAVNSYRNLIESFGHIQIAIGETTARALRKLGLEPLIAEEPSFQSVANKAVEVAKKAN